MQFENATYARSGRSIRIADSMSTFEAALIWLCCFYMQQHTRAWVSASKTPGSQLLRGDFERLNELVISGLVGSGPHVQSYAQRAEQDGFLELAKAIEFGAVQAAHQKTPPQRTWFSRTAAYLYCKVKGFPRGMSIVDDLTQILNRVTMSNYNSDCAVSFVKRTLPVLDELRAQGTPAANYAADLIVFLDRWDVQADGCLVLTP